MDTDNRGNNTENLIPWQPGQSGNPGGRPKGSKEFRERCREFADEKGLPVLIDIAESAKHKDRLKAVELLLAYGYGKPKQGVELSGDDGGDIKIIIERI
jgi:hypothetical protein